MTSDLHIDVAAYVAGLLDGEAARAFEAHLATCARCQAEARELEPTATLLAGAAGPLPAPPPELAARTLLAVQQADRTPEHPRRGRSVARPWRERLAWRPLALAGAAAFALLAVTLIAGDRRGSTPDVEVVATLRAPGGQSAAVSVTKTGIGRVIRFNTRDLPILPTGQYYELWWVGPGDRRGRPNRISAGTFHPDEQGRSQVQFAAAVDPARYRGIAVTAEPGDGDPAPTLPDVLTGRARTP